MILPSGFSVGIHGYIWVVEEIVYSKDGSTDGDAPHKDDERDSLRLRTEGVKDSLGGGGGGGGGGG